jgi:hypothetical protein
MRIWSIHPRYLDAKGLVALWREGLLAQKVLTGKTKGYRNHPQLIRFKNSRDPLALLGAYLHCVLEEANARDYSFDGAKILKAARNKRARIPVTRGQLEYETAHLFAKLKVRDPKKLKKVRRHSLQSHPLFYPVKGPIEPWEKVT